MKNVTKNEAIIDALRSAGYQQITLRVVPKLFQFNDGSCESELEFARNYFEDITLVALQGQMLENILPAIKQHFGKRIYVSAGGLTIISPDALA